MTDYNENDFEMDDEFEDDELDENGETLDPFDSFLNGIDEEGSQFDPTQVIKIMSTAGGNVDVPVDMAHEVNGAPGYTIDEVLTLANFAVGPTTQFWVNNAQVDRDYVVAAGAVVTAVGMVKGG